MVKQWKQACLICNSSNQKKLKSWLANEEQVADYKQDAAFEGRQVTKLRKKERYIDGYGLPK